MYEREREQRERDRRRETDRERDEARANFLATKLERSCGGILPLDFWFE